MIIQTRRRFAQATLALAAWPSAAHSRGLGRTALTEWRKLPTEPYKGKQDDLSAISPDVAWYGNGAGKLYATRDGGLSWQKIWEQPGTFIRALGFVDEHVGYLGNVGVDYYPGVTDRHPLYRTQDGGLSWTPVEAQAMEAVAGICAIHVLPVRRVFQGELRSTNIIRAAGRVGGPAALLTSFDDGGSWSVQDLSAQAGMILDVHFLDSQTGFLCAATHSDLEQAEALILRTVDGGRAWTPVYRSGRRFENCWKMSWPTRDTGYATVQSYNEDPANTRRVIVKSVDGGRSWRELPLVDQAGVQQFGIGFVDARRGWVGCKSGGYETRDGGHSWMPTDFGRAVNKIRVLHRARQTRVFAIGVDVSRADL